MGIRNRIPLKANLQNKLTPGLRACLSLGADMTGEFPKLSEEQLEDYLRSLWPVHRKEVLAHWIERFPGTRPRLWWEMDAPAGRPIIRPSNGTEEDCIREGRERQVAEIAFLLRHKLLSRAEQKALEQKGVKLDATDGAIE